MNYQQTLDWMFSRLPMFQRQGKTAFKKDLTNSLVFSERLDHPEKRYPIVHVAGTNGKGSTSHMIASVLQEAGYRVGLYTSPHLKDFRERIRLNGHMISEQEVMDFIVRHKTFLSEQGLSFFELTVGMAFDFFARHEVEVAVVEVGLGGRLDSTNIVLPLVSVITNIGYDHTQFLGESLQEIASEKGGIIKPGIPVVIGETRPETLPVFKQLAVEREAPIYLVDQQAESKYNTDLKGVYQQKNIRTAVKALELLRPSGFDISEEQIHIGLSKVAQNTGLKGRYQVLQEAPKVICDTAHNREGLEPVLAQVRSEVFEELHIVIGMVVDKDLEDILGLFPKSAKYYFCKPDIPRGLDVELLADAASGAGLSGSVYQSVQEGYGAARTAAGTDDLIYVGGSTFVVAEMPID